MGNYEFKEKVENLVSVFVAVPQKPYTLSELIGLAEAEKAGLSRIVAAQAMAQEKISYEVLLKR